MEAIHQAFDEHHVIHELKHYLPAQAPLKDFVHHNTLHAFQQLKFFDAMRMAGEIFGYKSTLTVDEYRQLYLDKRIDDAVLRRVIEEQKGAANVEAWLHKVLNLAYALPPRGRIGAVRSFWKKEFSIDLDSLVHPILFRTLCSYLDQGISIWDFPVKNKPFLAALRKLERYSSVSFFKRKRAKDLLLNTTCEIKDLLDLLVGDETLYAHYLFDQQFSHQGWSGMVSSVESLPESLLDARRISVHDLIVFELLLEIDALDYVLRSKWEPLARRITQKPVPLFDHVPATDQSTVIEIWQQAFEWTYFDQVLAGIQMEKVAPKAIEPKSFQALFCIDDRECSFRRYLEQIDPSCETFGTPGYFEIDTYFQPAEGKFYTKVCPGPITPTHLIKEFGVVSKRDRDAHFSKLTHSFHSGWLIAQTLGFWSALRLFVQLFSPRSSPATATSLHHMDHEASLTIENKDPGDTVHGLLVGYSVAEMTTRAENLLRSTGLIRDFAPLVYLVGHGASSTNNPHYAAYDCGACSGRAGSVNARAMAYMCNHPEVRARLREGGIDIPDGTQFLGALRDTTRDDILFYDVNTLTPDYQERNARHEVIFEMASDLNAKERSRRFMSLNSKLDPGRIHELVYRRSVSLFEPRPELNHATNALCIVGRREISKGLFLDRRSFLNSCDYRLDPSGKYLLNILKAAVPVCGGINLEYYFSRVDNQKLGAGSKLPHNVMGLIGVANGIDGDLRPGLPMQMIEVHDPVRILFVLEHFPEIVKTVIQEHAPTYEWFHKEWVNLALVHPETKSLYRWIAGDWVPFVPLTRHLESVSDLTPLIESNQENFPVYLIQ